LNIGTTSVSVLFLAKLCEKLFYKKSKEKTSAYIFTNTVPHGTDILNYKEITSHIFVAGQKRKIEKPSCNKYCA
jgi:hypothetical protein